MPAGLCVAPDDVPDHLSGDALAPYRADATHAAEQPAIGDTSSLGPFAQGGFHPVRDGNRSHMAGLADEIDHRPVLVPLLNIANPKIGNLAAPKATP